MRLRSERSLTDEPDPSLLDVALGESHQLVDEMHRGHGRVGGVFVRHRVDHLGRSLVALENPDAPALGERGGPNTQASVVEGEVSAFCHFRTPVTGPRIESLQRPT